MEIIFFGGSAWESNPPETLLAPLTGFEVQEAHQDLTTSATIFYEPQTLVLTLINLAIFVNRERVGRLQLVFLGPSF